MNAVEGKRKLCERSVEVADVGVGEEAQHLLRMLQQAHALQLVFAHNVQCRGLWHFVCGHPFFGSNEGVNWHHGQQIAHHLVTFSDEEPLAKPILLQLKRLDKFDFRFANHACKGSNFRAKRILLFVENVLTLCRYEVLQDL